jgi:YD repeat-containing protein
MWKSFAAISLGLLFVLVVFVGTSAPRQALAQQSSYLWVAHTAERGADLDILKALTGKSRPSDSNLDQLLANPADGLKLIASSGGWTQSTGAGSWNGSSSPCFNTANGDSVTTYCPTGTAGFAVLVDITGGANCNYPTSGNICDNPTASGGLGNCIMTGTFTAQCSANSLAGGGYAGTMSIGLYILDSHGNRVQVGTEAHAWSAKIFPNSVASPPATGVFPGPNRSCDPCQANTGHHPVNVITGELWYRRIDAALSGPFGLIFKRFYTAQTTFSGDLGNNWRHTYDANLDVSRLGSSGQVWAYDNENTLQVFFGVANGSTSYDSTSGSTLALSADGSTYTLTTFSGTVSTFDASGRLLSIKDRIGNLQTITRDSLHGYRISTVTDVLGRSLNFGYDSSNRINSVTSVPLGISLVLSYGGSGCGSNDLCGVTESDGNRWSYQYDTSNPTFPHNLTKVIDPNGNPEEVNIYQPSQNVIQEQYEALDSHSNKIGDLRFAYSTGLTNVTDAVGRLTHFLYALNRLTQISGPLCNCGGNIELDLSYDQYGRLLSWTDRLGHKTTYAYGRDSYGSDGIITAAYPGPTQIVEPLTSTTSRTWVITYYSIGDLRQDLPQTITYPSADTSGNNDTVTNTFSTTGLLINQAVLGYINGSSTTYTTAATYDSRGRVQQITGPRTDVTQHTNFGYYSDTDSDLARRGQLQTITDAASHVTTYAGDTSPFNTYTLYGEPTSVADPNGVIADLSYDALGRLTTHTIKGVSGDPTPLITSLSYDPAGRLTKLTRPLGNGVSYAYDVANRLTNAIRFAASTGYAQEQLALAYDLANELTTETAQSCTPPAPTCTAVTTQTESAKYDSYARLSEIDHPIPSGSKIVIGYDYGGNLKTVQDENHATANTTYAYDSANRVTSATQTLAGAPGNQIITQFGYDVQDNLNSNSDPNGNQTTYAFDDFGRARSQNSPVSGLTSYTYDADGNPLTVTDANTATTTSTFDALDRILMATSTRTGYTTESVTWTYDDATSGHFGIGRLASMTDPTGATTLCLARFRGHQDKS